MEVAQTDQTDENDQGAGNDPHLKKVLFAGINLKCFYYAVSFSFIDSSGLPLFAPSVALLGAFPYKPVESK